jgi:UDP-N-acetylmuramoyl-L-alanyl-D-glutamate--2,6-diaminopimelate ligase
MMEPQSGTIGTADKVGVSPMSMAGKFTGLASDSRKVKPGYLFAAVPGTRVDGAAFVADAVRRGATAVLGLPQVRSIAQSHGVRFIADDNPRRRLALMAAEHFACQPSTVAAVTGTNGKTSVTVFLRQIWTSLGRKATSLGTIGVVAPSLEVKLEHTTPDPIELHSLLARLSDAGLNHLALEASSHGLDQYRLDGVQVKAAAFTNITRDHLDYHADFEHYLRAKLRLFTDILQPDGAAVINADALHADTFLRTAKRCEAEIVTVGAAGETLKLVACQPQPYGQSLSIAHAGRCYDIALPLAGGFQASNALVAAGLAIGLGESAEQVIAAMGRLKGAPGRLQKVAFAASGAPVYVDYAHTPDALANVLSAIRPHVAGRLHVVFGCGGDRDPGKRPLMGEIAVRLADSVIVTDDNPRNEDAAAIRRAVLAGCPSALEIGDREQAITRAMAALGPGDALIIAGKGHESGQIIGAQLRPFSDAEEAVKAALALGGRPAEPLQ